MAIWGADVQQLRQLGSKLQAGASEIESQRTNLTSLLNNTEWRGPDADRFKDQWNGEHTKMLNQVAEALKEAGNKAKRNAEEQSNASQGA
ncbi:WXG100 family type VII secretion target [Arthrobacter sp. ZGTC412]|uniref:WXG100 family type VII secretion target n=1 Tax=Arthrobacter sp. ZGTC412 TaxID=2058900 RepID=UPI000CE410E2|nr:WXG100 family type VII secretion target [Arthrobacter sp. ZGTC412]